jgi:hypothetical protein
MKKGLAITFIIGGLTVGGYIGYLLVKRVQEIVIDSRTVSLEEALKKLNEAK